MRHRPPWRWRKLDLQWGGKVLGGAGLPTRFAHQGAYAVQETPYPVLAHLFDVVGLEPQDVIVDVGCGRGRVMNFLLSRGVPNPMVGLELDPEVAQDTRDRLSGYPNVEIVTGDAVENLPPQGTVFYLYNPFAHFVVRRFVQAVSALPTAQRLRVIYYNCLHLEPFRQDPGWWLEVISVPGHNQAALCRRVDLPLPPPPAQG